MPHFEITDRNGHTHVGLVTSKESIEEYIGTTPYPGHPGIESYDDAIGFTAELILGALPTDATPRIAYINTTFGRVFCRPDDIVAVKYYED